MADKDLGGNLAATATTPTLASCPFCGEAPTFIPSGWDGKDETGPWVMCETWLCALHKHETELMAWNRRAPLTPSGGPAK